LGRDDVHTHARTHTHTLAHTWQTDTGSGSSSIISNFLSLVWKIFRLCLAIFPMKNVLPEL